MANATKSAPEGATATISVDAIVRNLVAGKMTKADVRERVRSGSITQEAADAAIDAFVDAQLAAASKGRSSGKATKAIIKVGKTWKDKKGNVVVADVVDFEGDFAPWGLGYSRLLAIVETIDTVKEFLRMDLPNTVKGRPFNG